jgi:hypothetical protein
MTLSTAANLFPEVWSKGVELSAYSYMQFRDRAVVYTSEDVAAAGGWDVLHVPKLATITAQTYSALSPLVFSNTTEAICDITPSLTYAAISVSKNVGRRLTAAAIPGYIEQLGKSVAGAFDTSMAGLYSGLSQSVGSSSVNIDETLFLSAWALIMASYAEGPYTLALHPLQAKYFAAVSRFFIASNRGDGASPMVSAPGMNGYLTTIHGVDCYMNGNLTSSSGRHNLMYAKRAFAGAVFAPPEIEAGKDAEYGVDTLTAWYDYGVAELNDTYAVDVITSAT